MTTIATKPARDVALWRACGIALVGLIVLLHVPYPFDHDQGFFMAGARAIAGGAKLYVDFWDMKQPGMYWYFLAAGEAFGFNEIGLHLLDLIWMVALAWVLVRVAARMMTSELAIALTPIICLGPFYAATKAWHMSQVESLVALPIAGTLALLLPLDFRARGAAWRMAGAGALGAVVIVLKAMLAVIPAAMILAAAWFAWRRSNVSLGVVFARGLVPALAGTIVALLPAILYLWHDGTLGQALWTLFTYPRLAVAEYPIAPPWRLRLGIEWFMHATWILFPFALYGAWRGFRGRALVATLAAIWIVGSGLETLAQTLSWWEYHFDLFFVPLGLFAALGFDALLSDDAAKPARWRVGAAALGLVVLAATIAVPVARKIALVFADPSPFTDRMAVMRRIDHGFLTIQQETQMLDAPGALPGDIAILGGDGRMMLYADRPILWSVNGAAHFLSSQVTDEAHAIEHDRPAYIYLAPASHYLYTHGTDEIERYVAQNYVEKMRDVSDGVWYERRADTPAPEPAAPPAH
jgi:hypothetical protein